MLSPLVIVPLVFRAVGPAFLAVAMLLVLFPIACVHCTVRVDVCSFSMSLVVGPFSFVDVTISMIKLSIAACAVQLVVAFIARAIRPLLSAEPVSQRTKPLSCVDATRCQRDGALFDSLKRAFMPIPTDLIILTRGTLRPVVASGCPSISSCLSALINVAAYWLLSIG